MLGRTKKKNGDSVAIPKPEILSDGVHTRMEKIGSALNVVVKIENVTEREADPLHDEILTAVRSAEVSRLLVDLGRVTILTSAGIGTLVRLHKAVSAQHGRLVVYGLSDDISDLLKLTRIDRLFPLRDDLAAALAATK